MAKLALYNSCVTGVLLSPDVAWEEDAMLGPIFIQDTYVKWDQEVHAGEQQVQAEAQHSHMLAEDPSEAGNYATTQTLP